MTSCKYHDLDSDQQRCVCIVDLVDRGTGALLRIGTTHLESGTCSPADLRVTQLCAAMSMVERVPAVCSVLAGDFNIRDWEAHRAKVGDDGGKKWQDAWHKGGAMPSFQATWKEYRFDRIFWRSSDLEGVSPELIPDSFRLLHATESDHQGVCCTLLVPRVQPEQIQAIRGLADPLRRGARGRVGNRGVARRPGKFAACAKVEPSTAHDAGGPQYYCGKCFEKPRIPAGEAALIEDDRRRDLWRLCLQRNSPFINGFMVLVAWFLCANMDAQVVATLKGAVDYVAKYISKYGAGQSVNARIGSLIDDIITKLPEGRKTTVASILAKAFVATAVPDSLCALEAWHVLLDLGRVVCSRGFVSLQADATKALRNVAIPKQPTAGVDVADALNKTLPKKMPVERYCDRFAGTRMGTGVSVEWLDSCCLATFQAEVEMRGDTLYRRRKAKIVKVKPYLNLDMGSPHAPRMARMALRLYRPFNDLEDDPAIENNLTDEEAIAQLELFLRTDLCPRWLQERYRQHNRVRTRKRKADESSVQEAADDVDALDGSRKHQGVDAAMVDTGEDDWFTQADLVGLPGLVGAEEVAALHGFRWGSENTFPNQAFSVRDALGRAGRKTPTAYLKDLLAALAPNNAIPVKKSSRMAKLAHYILHFDLEPFATKGRGVFKSSLPGSSLREAARIWQLYHPMSSKEDIKGLRENLPYAVLWQNLKRRILGECGLCVLAAPSRRIYFEHPHDRPTLSPAAHASVKEGQWREKVIVPTPYAPDAQDEDMQDDGRRKRSYVRSAAYEQAMGRGGLPEEEVPVMLDEEALDCPDNVTKNEWDAMWPYEDLVRPVPINPVGEPVPLIPEGDERLSWVLPEREGGCNAKDFAEVVRRLAPPREEEDIPSLDALDPTQRAFAQMGLQWYQGQQQHFRALLLGTAGTGKTTTLKALLKELKNIGLRKFVVGAYTGVAASNIGSGARTLTDLFRLAKVNEASGDLIPLEGDDLTDFLEDMQDLELLIVDEVSMVSRVVLSQIHDRLRQWRLATNRLDLAEEYFGGVAVILAGDFGQLPPVAISPSLSLLNDQVLRNVREQKAANQALRILGAFDTVVRLRRIHRQPGASHYKESLLRIRDGAATKEDHALWCTHNLSDIDTCSLSPEERDYFENKVPHLFAENAVAGARNGFKAGQRASTIASTVLRVSSADSSDAAARQQHDQYGQLRRVVHIVGGAPVMLLANVRTSVGLVNGAVGYVVAAVLAEGAGNGEGDLRNAIAATDLRYVVVDFPKYVGPAFFADHPTWVPVRPLRNRHKRIKQWQRIQIPLALAWGVTIHKSQGLTFPDGVVVDFCHQPTYQPVAHVGLAFVGMSRCTSWEKQAFRNIPGYWEFRKMLKEPLFRWRSAFEDRMDSLHDATMERFRSRAWTVDLDLDAHAAWSSARRGCALSEAELSDLRGMLAVRGVLPAPQYDDEPQPGPRGLQGGGGRKHKMGMRAPAEKRRKVQEEASDQQHDEVPADAVLVGQQPEIRGMVGRSMREEMSGDTSSSVSAYAGYFERQVRGRCGMHALNNALGFGLVTAADMTQACNVYLAEMQIEGSPEDRRIHENIDGWYSEAVMAQALRIKDNLYKLDLDNPLQPREDNLLRIYADNVHGLVLNKLNRHWVAFRLVDGSFWRLDSQLQPEVVTLEHLSEQIARYRNAFLVYAIANG